MTSMTVIVIRIAKIFSETFYRKRNWRATKQLNAISKDFLDFMSLNVQVLVSCFDLKSRLAWKLNWKG